MPCPLFEPQVRITRLQPEIIIRFPLLYEFEGVCHATGHAPPPDHSLRHCNHGYAKGHCASFPDALAISAVRFSVARQTPSELTVLVLEEENHWPRHWAAVEFSIQDHRLCPEIEDTCRRAQIIQFCCAFLKIAATNDAAIEADYAHAANS
jgi:hypothetical protein